MIIRVVALVLVIASPGVSAQSAVDGGKPVSAVVLDGQELFRVRGVKVFTSEKRAQHISERLRILANDYSVSVQSLSVIDDAVSTDVIAGDQILFSLLDTDAEPEGTTRQALGRTFAEKVATAIEKYRQERTPWLRDRAAARHISDGVDFQGATRKLSPDVPSTQQLLCLSMTPHSWHSCPGAGEPKSSASFKARSAVHRVVQLSSQDKI